MFKDIIVQKTPVWFLRQAGRHIPEYFSIRSKAKDFIDFCLNTELVVESTKLPLKYYDLDAAIVFSDIFIVEVLKKDSSLTGINPIGGKVDFIYSKLKF